MKSLLRIILVFAGAILFSSCSKSNDEGKMIPKDAMFIAFLNTKSLLDKVSWDDVKQTSWYKQLYADTSMKPWVKKMLDNPDNSGIDIKAGIAFFVQKGTGNDYHIVLEGKLSDEKNFEQFNQNFAAPATVVKDGDVSMLTLKEQGVVGWSDKHFAYVSNSSSYASKYASQWDTLDNQANMAPAAGNTAGLSAYCKGLFSIKSDSSLSKNEKFSNLLSEKGDIHGWINSEEIMHNGPALGMLGMLKLDIFFKDNISTYTVDFDNGKIDINQKAYAGKEFLDFLKKYKGGSINTNMIANIPSQNIVGILAMNYKPEAIKEFIKLLGMDGMLNNYINEMGFNIDDFVKANNGDLLLAVTDLRMKSDSFNYKDDQGNNTSSTVYSRPDANYLFSVGIGDRQSFQKLVEAGKKLSSGMGGSIDNKVAFNLNDKTFAIGNQQPFVNQYLGGGNNKFDFVDKINGKPIGLYVDIQKILSTFNTDTMMIKDEDARTIMTESLKIWNKVYSTGGEFDNDAMVGHTEISLVDQSTNSLKQLNHYFDEVAKVMLAKMEREKSQSNQTDSLMMPPPIDTIGK
ncbi:MAG: DUF4836 family protein [Bacteroidota bacterium]|nr:DUF4836 family protein [Bacteroidota bacterium]